MPTAVCKTSAVQVNGSGAALKDRAGVAKYIKYWGADASKDTEEHKQARLGEYTGVVNGYYDGATDLFEQGWGQNFHFARFNRGEAFAQAMARHEHYLSAHMGIKPGMRVLDVGCGVGGPAREIARFADCHIVGVNNNEYQLNRARAYTAKEGMDDQVEFVRGDFMQLANQFGENSFDAVYAIEATCHAPSWEGVYGEIKKVLKPGGVVGIYEWCMTDAYDKENPAHRRISHGIEIGDGIAEMRTINDARSALKAVGLEIMHEDDLAARKDPVPWYYPIRGHFRDCQTFSDVFLMARMARIGKTVVLTLVKILETLGVAPKGTSKVGAALYTAADALVAGGETKLFTPMMLFIARKPE